ncbi:MAG: nucleotidyl transferase AbiEii/AbiGii toxin family protein [Patescibacteria group bacterium]
MITNETIEKLAKLYRMSVFPNIVREYFQHVFLQKLYALEESERLLFKGGTALRIVYGSPRFSEDLDFSLFGFAPHETKKVVENIFIKVLADIEQTGIQVEIGEKSDSTRGGSGYFGTATLQLFNYGPIGVEINISGRDGRNVRGEVDSVTNDFVSTYTVIHLPQQELVEEKIFGALRERKKPRDYYDLYFIMRKGMLSSEQKSKLAEVKAEIVSEAGKINFQTELGVFLPVDQQSIIRDFARTLAAEMDRQLASL